MAELSLLTGAGVSASRKATTGRPSKKSGRNSKISTKAKARPAVIASAAKEKSLRKRIVSVLSVMSFIKILILT